MTKFLTKETFLICLCLVVYSCKSFPEAKNEPTGFVSPSYDVFKKNFEDNNLPNTFKVSEDLNGSRGLMAGPSASAPCNDIEPVPEPETVSKAIADFPKNACEKFKIFKEAGVPEKALRQALTFYYQNETKFSKNKKISIADYSMNSKEKRFFELDMTTGKVIKNKVSHGSGKIDGVNYGDKEHEGNLESCKHTLESQKERPRQNMTRPGFFITEKLEESSNHPEEWNDAKTRLTGGWPDLDSSGNNKLILDGLTPGVNDQAKDDAVVMHGAWYNYNDVMGRSWGCPAFHPKEAPKITKRIKGGSLYYSYVPKCADDMQIVEKQIPGWDKFCPETEKKKEYDTVDDGLKFGP